MGLMEASLDDGGGGVLAPDFCQQNPAARYGNFIRGYLSEQLSTDAELLAIRKSHGLCSGIKPRQAKQTSPRRRASQFDSVKVEETEWRRGQRQREACEMLRILVFGCVGNEHFKSTEKNKIFEQSRGTSSEVGALVELWEKLDTDYSGDVDAVEFAEYFAEREGGKEADKVLGLRC